jgi:phosphinothricin acetyltransferase
MSEIAPEISIRSAMPKDAGPIAEIYNHHVANTIVTFDEDPVSSSEMARRLDEAQSGGWPWLVACEGESVVGYAYGAAWRPRPGYRFSAEVTVYVAPGQEGRGIGSRLYHELIPRLQSHGAHSLMGGIALPNDASVALHEKFGFKKVAHFEDAGIKFDRWIDVGYWQRLL